MEKALPGAELLFGLKSYNSAPTPLNTSCSLPQSPGENIMPNDLQNFLNTPPPILMVFIRLIINNANDYPYN